MEFKKKDLKNNEIELTVTISEKEMEEYLKDAANEISKDVKVKGFRPGHVPMHVLENYVDKKYITAHARDLAIKKNYAKLVMQEKIPVAGRPKLDVDEESNKDSKDFTFKLVAPVMPEIEIKDYKKIKVKKEEAKVTKKEVDEVIDDLRKRSREFEESDKKAEMGDRAEIDFAGFDEDGKAVENTESKNHPVILGEKTLIEGFEENIVGLKAGEEKEFDITFPKDYFKKDFQNKKMKFKIKVHKVEKPNLPEVNDKFIEKVTGKKKSVDEFKKEVEENILAKKKQENKNKREKEYVEELLKKLKVDISDLLIDEEVEHIIKEVKEDIEYRGAEFEKFLEQSQTTLEDLRKKYRPEAEKRIKTRLALQYVIKEEKVEISKEEIDKEFERVKSFYPESEHAKIEKDFRKGQLKASIVNRLALRKMFEKVLD